MTSQTHRSFWLLTIGLSVAAQFVWNMMVPNGQADWVFYFLPLYLSVKAGNRNFSYWLAAVISLLMLGALYFSPTGLDWQAALPGRLIRMGAIWLMAWLIVREKDAQEKLARTERARHTISACNQVLVHAGSEAALLHGLCHIIVGKGGYRMAWVGFAENDPAKTLRVAASAGCEEGYLAKAGITWSETDGRGRGPTGVAIRTGETVVCNDFQTDARTAPWWDEGRQRGYLSSITIPLKHGGRNFGVLVIYAGERDAFTPNEVALLTELADDLAFGINSLRACQERATAEAALRASEERFRKLFNGHAAAQLVVDPETEKIIDANEAAARFYGWTVAQLKQMSISQINILDATALREVIKEVKFSEKTRFEFQHRLADGSIRDVEVFSNRIEIAGKILLYSIIHDITESKRFEEQLKMLKFSIDTHFDGVYWMDTDNKFFYVNNAGCAALGYTQEELLGKSLREVAPKVTEDALKRIWEKLRKDGFYYSAESLHRRKDGSVFPVEIVASYVSFQGREYNCGFARDITERKQAEAALLESARQLKESQRIAKLGTYVLDVASGRWSSSDLLDELFGIGPDYEYSVAGWVDLIHPDDRAMMLDHFQNEVLGQKMSFNREYRIRRHRDQVERWVHGLGQLEFDAQGQPVKMIGTIQDITKRKKTLELMVASEIRYRRLFETAKDGILILDADTGMVVDVNPFLTKLLGYSHTEILDKKVWELGFLKDIIANEANFAELQAKEYIRYENLALETRDGRRVEVEFVSNLYRVNGHKVIQCNIRDITARKRAEAELLRLHSQQELILSSAAEGIIGLDLQGHHTFVNRAAARLLGYKTPEELVGQPSHSLWHHTKMDGSPYPEAECNIYSTLQDGLVHHSADEVFWRQDGTKFFVEYDSTPIFNAGKLVGAVVTFMDITERRRMEQELASNNARLRAIIEAEPECVKVVSPEGRLLEMNPAGLKMIEAESLAQAQSRPLLEFVVPEYQAAFRTLLERVTQGQSGMLEFECVGLKGQRHWLETHAVPLRDPHSNVTNLLGVTRNITERKLAEEKTLFQNELSQAMLELPQQAEQLEETAFIQHALATAEQFSGSQISFCHFVNDDGQTIELATWSRRTLEVYCRAVHEKHYPMQQAGIWADAFRQQQPVIFNDYAAHPHKHGLPEGHSELKRLISLPVLDNGKVVMLLGVGNKPGDYTDQDVNAVQHIANLLWRIVSRRREFSIRSRLAAAVEQAAETIVITDTAGTITYVNPAFEKSTGYTQAEALGKNARIIKSGRQDATFYREMWATIKRGEVWQGHFANKRKDGTIYEEEAVISPIRDAKGNITSFVGVKRDVTHEVKLEGQLRQSQKMQAMGTLAGGIAHDFNNILTVMFGYCNLLQLDLVGHPEPLAKLGEILKAGERAKDLVQQILTFSRQREQQRQVIHLEGIIKEALKLLRSSLPATIQIEAELKPETPTVLADATQIYQIIMNLGINALHAMGEQSGRLTVKLEAFQPDEAFIKSHLELRAIPYARLTVADTGHGMDARTMERIFEPFFTTKPVGKGTGLGLAVVHGIVETHDGVITVASQPGQGTTFTVYFPAQLQEMFLTGIPDRKIPCGHWEKILVVDDEPALTKMYQRLLKTLRYEGTVTNSPDEAVAWVRKNPAQFDLVITDLTMPEMNGLELARQVRELRADLPVILATGFKGMVTDRQLHDAGICELLEKPISVNTIAGVLQHRLGKKPGGSAAA